MALAKKMKKRLGAKIVARVLYLFASTIIVLGFIMLIILIVHILIPYLRVKDYILTNCTLSHIKYAPSFNCSAEFEKSRIAEFPCIQMYMVFKDARKVNHTALLRETEYSLTNKHDCSYSSCGRFKWENDKNVDIFKRKYGKKNTPYPCHYDPTDTSKLIAGRVHYEKQVMHCLLWPSFCIVFGFLVILIIYFFTGCDIWGPRIATVMWEKSLKRIEMEQEIKRRTVITNPQYRVQHDHNSYNGNNYAQTSNTNHMKY